MNREITGAKVGRQPFGGGRRSGTGPKVGGPGYALAFVEPCVVCENTMRHGLTVDQSICPPADVRLPPPKGGVTLAPDTERNSACAS